MAIINIVNKAKISEIKVKGIDIISISLFHKFKIDLRKIFYKKANSKVCLVCKDAIKEAREVFM